MFKSAFLTFSILLLVSACASRPASISASHVSHEKYMAGDCSTLATNMSEARQNLEESSKKQNSKATGDAIGVFLLGIPFSKLSGDFEADVAKHKGEIEAIETAQIKKKCS